MSEIERAISLSILLAEMIKRGEITRLLATKIYRTAFGTQLAETLFMIDSAIGNLNEGVSLK
jgi:hypothetical protein